MLPHTHGEGRSHNREACELRKAASHARIAVNLAQQCTVALATHMYCSYSVAPKLITMIRKDSRPVATTTDERNIRSLREPYRGSKWYPMKATQGIVMQACVSHGIQHRVAHSTSALASPS